MSEEVGEEVYVKNILLRRPAIKRLGASVQVNRISKNAYNELINEYVKFLDYFISDIVAETVIKGRTTTMRPDIINVLLQKGMIDYYKYLSSPVNVWENVPHYFPFSSFSKWLKYRLNLTYQNMFEGNPLRVSIDALQSIYMILQKRLQVIMRRGKMAYVLAKQKTLNRKAIRLAVQICDERGDILRDMVDLDHINDPYDSDRPYQNVLLPPINDVDYHIRRNGELI